MFSKIFATKYQKAGKWWLFLCMGVIGPRVIFMLLFSDVWSQRVKDNFHTTLILQFTEVTSEMSGFD